MRPATPVPGANLTALEFFCGLGGFAAAARELGIAVAAAYDQDADAAAVYAANFGRAPDRRTLDTVDLSSLPEADCWWLSPPCTPFTRRGARRDAADPRAAAFLRLIEEAARRRHQGCGPRLLVIENVLGFIGSEVHRRLGEVWTAAGCALAETVLCPTMFGIPMKRPRVFLAAVADGPPPALEPPRLPSGGQPLRPLAAWLDPAAMADPRLQVPAADVARYGPALNILDPAAPGACAICFTSGYGKSWKAAGSYLQTPGGGLRRFSPQEILRLMGFPPGFHLPAGLTLQRGWHLAGNSLSLDCVRHVLQPLAQPLSSPSEIAGFPAAACHSAAHVQGGAIVDRAARVEETAEREGAGDV